MAKKICPTCRRGKLQVSELGIYNDTVIYVCDQCGVDIELEASYKDLMQAANLMEEKKCL